MSESNKLGFYTVLATIFLLPVFFIPSGLVPLGIAKTVLLTLAVLLSMGSFVVALFKDGRLSLTKSKLLWGALILPVVYLVSAGISSTPKLSLFGYGLELGTAMSVVMMCALFFFAALFFRDRARLVRGYSALFASFALLALFVLIRVFSEGEWLSFGTFSGAMGNPAGSWIDLAGIFAILAVLCAFALEMLPLGRLMSVVSWAAFALSLVLLAMLGFSTIWAMVLGAGLVLLTYFLTVEKTAPEEGASKRQGTWAAAILSFVALIFVWNPVFSTQGLRESVSSAAGLNNLDVRPSLSATLDVARSAISEHPVLGSGPQTFDKQWLLYKSPSVNNTVFWNTAFPFGFGFIPTAFAVTGIIGTLAWILFLAFFIMLGVKILRKSPERRADRFLVMAPFIVSLLLWLSAFLFTPSITLIALAFIFTGLTLGAAEAMGILGASAFDFHGNKLARFVSTLAALILVVGALGLGVVAAKKTAAAWHFQKAIALAGSGASSVDEVESELAQAVTISEADQYWIALSQVELARANAALQDSGMPGTERQSAFQNALSKSIAALQNATALNPTYSNYVMLGNLYASLVPAPFSLGGAYESALAAYQNASALHPASPEIALLRARVEFDNKNIEAARMHIDEALALKADYADAYFFQAQIEIQQNNLPQAIQAAETGVLLTPNNAGVLFELGLLKYSNRDYAGAVEALRRALSISPDYANAKYYLGLSHDALGNKDEALAQFEDLAKTNADNAAVQQILENLRAGKRALAETPASTQRSTTAPISGQ